MLRYRRIPCLISILALLALLALVPGPARVSASWLLSEESTPGATGTATLRGVAYLYARRGDRAVWVRKTDGLWYSGWSPVGGTTDLPPAVASTDTFISVFLRSPDGALWANRTEDGYSYDGWRRLGDPLAVAPAAVGFHGQIYVFARDAQGMLWVRASSDGYHYAAPTLLGGPLSAAPVAVVVGDTLTVFGRDLAGRLYTLAGLATEQGQIAWANWLLRGGDVFQQTPAGWHDQPLAPLTLDLGINFISANDWQEYQLPAYERLNPTLAKFSLFYDGDYRRPMFGPEQLDDAIARGARTVIIRTAETHIGPEEIDEQLNTPLRGDTRSLLDYIREYYERGSDVEFWLEVGNEPDVAGLSPLVARYALLATIRDIAPRYRAAHPNLRWLAALPTKEGLKGGTFPAYQGLSYLDLLLSDQGDGLGDIASRYDALGVHLYGADTLQQSFPAQHEPTDLFDCALTNGDAQCPTVVLDRVLSQTDRPIFITEVGINSTQGWTTKAKLYLEALYRLPARVRGVAIFTLSLDPEWYAGAGCSALETGSCSRYALDVDAWGVVDLEFAGATSLGQCQTNTPVTAPLYPVERPVKGERLQLQEATTAACLALFAGDGSRGQHPTDTPGAPAVPQRAIVLPPTSFIPGRRRWAG